jgi:hypothetical protein
VGLVDSRPIVKDMLNSQDSLVNTEIIDFFCMPPMAAFNTHSSSLSDGQRSTIIHH